MDHVRQGRGALSLLLAALAAVGLPRPAAAQSGPQSNLVLTILGGAVASHDLWSIPRQPLLNIAATQHDTIALTRNAAATFIAGASATYYPSGNVGLHAEIAYTGHPYDDDCRMLSTAPDSTNAEICDNVTSGDAGGGAMTFAAGVSLRARRRGWLVPYARAGAGIVVFSTSSAQVAGTYGFPPSLRVIVEDNGARRTAPLVVGALGLTAAMGTGYALRVELRDFVAGETVVTGSADDLGVAPTDVRMSHHVALTLGFDVVLERKRPRRY